VVSFLLLLTPTLSANSEDERFVEGLRARRLFRLAEDYCQETLADTKLEPAPRAALTIEYMLTLSQHAAYSPAQERDKYWKTARALADKFPPEHPRKLVVDLQAALVALAQGELARQEAEARGEEFTAALALLREASKGLDELDKKVAQQIALRRPANKEQLTSEELDALQHNVRYQLARARRNQGLCYKAGSDDRVAALRQALEQLDKLKELLAPDDPILWRVKLDEGLCTRLLEDHAAAARILTGLLGAGVPPATQWHARAELARVSLALQRPEEALRIIEAGKTSSEQFSAELEFALLETDVALWKKAETAKDIPSATRYRQEAATQLAGIERQFGAYWARRGERLVLGSASVGNENLDLLARAADARFIKGKFDDETLKAYDNAAKLALEANNPQRYLELAYRAAVVQQRREQLPDAAQRLLSLGEALAERMPDELLLPKAAAAHLQGLQWLQSLPHTEAKARDALIAALERHLMLFPKSLTCGDAALALADLQLSVGKTDAAIATYEQVPADHARRGHAMLAAARLVLETKTDGYADAEALLTKALIALPDAEPQQRETAHALLVVALAGQPKKRDEAAQELAKLGGDSPQQLLAMLDGLTRLAREAQPKVRSQLAALQLQGLELLQAQTKQLTAEQRVALARIEAEALAASGQRDKALAAYERLAKEQPASAAIQEGYAAALAAGSDRNELTKALAQWRVIAARTKPQTERWFHAKYEVAALNFRLGDKAQAAQLIKYLQATSPDLAGSSYEKKFADLLRKCE
jgi:hypothetical protein